MQKINHIFVKKIKMKNTEPEIGQLVYVFNKDIFVTVIDSECVEGVSLYYTDDNCCYIDEQLHYIPKQKPESDDVKKILSWVIDDWLTPDKALRINVNILKKLNEPFGKVRRLC